MEMTALALPAGAVPMHGIAAAGVGIAASSILNPPQSLGKAVGLSAEALTTQQYADVVSESLGREVRETKITLEASKKLGFPGAEE